MMRLALSFFCLILTIISLSAQEKPTLDYYLPAVTYNPAIPTPAQYLGYEVGEWHVTHDQLVGYMRELDRLSDRITLQEYARTHEQRPLLCLTITTPENHARIEAIKAERQKLTDPAQSSGVDAANLPAVNYMGYSIHGNEPSGSNASLLVAYYLAAARTPEVEQMLKNQIILLDPCFNPDGMQRFSGWVNSRKSIHNSADNLSDEFNETWPRGRYNHYWFDLNRDWLVAQQPESGGRVAIFQEWHPNVLTDHHEMGSNNTFFFQPGVASRVNPITPARNQELTAKIGRYHAEILSDHGISFFTGENFDDFYYGKGSTYPDAQGCMGILFEQASSRGIGQETENGLLTFPYTIRNQVFASLSTLKAVREMRGELNEYLRDFYKSGIEEARKDEVKGYLFGDQGRDIPTRELLAILLRHKIEVRNLTEDVTVEGKKFGRSNAFWVPCEQPQYRLIKGIFTRQTTFQDSIFYDISAWTLPDAFGLQWTPVKAKDVNNRWVSAQKGVSMTIRFAPSIIAKPAYAYVFPAVGYDLPNLMIKLLEANIRVKVATNAFEAEGQKFAAGSLLITNENQSLDSNELLTWMNQRPSELPVVPIYNGLTPDGPDLGSDLFRPLKMPKVVLLTGEGVQPEPAGAAWHLLDTRYGLPISLIETSRFNRSDISKYNVLILSDGSYSNISADKVKRFIEEGGTVVASGGGALRWLKTNNLAALEFKNTPSEPLGRRPYDHLEEDRAAFRLPGAIFEADLDLSHPLCFGYERDKLPIFLGDTIFLETAKNPYASPVIFTEKPLLAGYVHPKQKALANRAAAVVVCGQGRGRVICFAGEPNFRAFWYGTNRMFANAIFFGNMINGDAVERKK